MTLIVLRYLAARSMACESSCGVLPTFRRRRAKVSSLLQIRRGDARPRLISCCLKCFAVVLLIVVTGLNVSHQLHDALELSQVIDDLFLSSMTSSIVS